MKEQENGRAGVTVTIFSMALPTSPRKEPNLIVHE